MAERHEEQHVTIHAAPKPDDTGDGMQAIIGTFLRNPKAAIELFVIIGGAFGLYYGMSGKIGDVQASSEAHYKDIATEMHNANSALSTEMHIANDKLAAQFQAFTAAYTSENAQQTSDIKALIVRGDTRFTALQERLASNDVKNAKVEDNLEFIKSFIQQHSAPGVTR